MGHTPKPSERRKRLGRYERMLAEQKHAAQQQPLPDLTTEVTITRDTSTIYEDVGHARLGRALAALLADHNDGVVKICPTEDWQVCYVYWRWTRGQWAGHYVCRVTTLYALDAALRGLLRSVEDVVEGNKRPTKDRFGG